MHRTIGPLLLAAVLAVGGCGGDDSPGDGSAAATPTPTPAATATPAATPEGGDGGEQVRRRVLAGGLEVPWGVAFLPGGDALVSERTTGRILRIGPDGRRKGVAMELGEVDTGAGEGGLLGLAVSPGYADDRLVYAYYTTAGDNRIVRFELGGEVRPVLTGLQRSGIHNGGRIAFGPDGKLYAGVGDASQPGLAQDRASLNGKILRMNPDGSVPQGNPFDGSLVWTSGHRNVQGLAWDEQGRMWATEFGQNEFDEINLIRKGDNYGWPEVEGRGDTRGGTFTDPVLTWRPSEASPSGLAYAGGRLYAGALRGQGVWRVPVDGTSLGEGELLYEGEYGRVRTVVRAPGGGLWITTSNRDGRGSPAEEDDRIVQVPVR